MVARADEFTARPKRAVATPARRRPFGYSKSQRLSFVGALLVFAIAAFYAGGALLTRAYPALFPGEQAPFSNVLGGLPGPVRVEQPGAESVFNKRINFLVIGVDRRSYEDMLSAHRTDVLMVATIDPVTKIANLLSFPRDLYIDYYNDNGDVIGSGRINESWGYGVEQGESFEAGFDQLAGDIKGNFGIEVDNWVVLDFQGVEQMIDSIGGITIEVPEELAVPEWYYGDESGRIDPHWISFPPGVHKLEGYYAVAYGRYRGDSDLNRVKRQQLVVQTAAQQVFAGGILNDPIAAYNAYKDMVVHNVAVGDMPGLANLFRQAGGRIHTFSVGDPVDGRPTVWQYITPSGADVLQWDPANVQYWINQVFTKSTYAASNIEIQNGFGPDGGEEVAKMGRYLRFAKGFPTVYRGPDVEVQPTSTIVVNKPDRLDMAEDIADWMQLPSSAIEVQNNADQSLPDVVIVLGQDFVVPGG